MNWRHLTPFAFITIFVLTGAVLSHAEKGEDNPIPVLTIRDIGALYSAETNFTKMDHLPGDWNYPKLKDYPHQKELTQRCLRDWAVTIEKTPDPFHRGHQPLGAGKLLLGSITKDPKNRIVYFNFSYESELVFDLFIIYYYDPYQDRFILKTAR